MGDGTSKSLRIRIKYEKGSQTLNQCKTAATDEKLFAAAMAILSLRQDELAEVSKIQETHLVG